MTDTRPLTLFQQLYQRAPTAEERQRLVNVKMALGLSDRDELWPLILVFEHYAAVNQRASYNISNTLKELPTRVQSIVDTTEKTASRAADHAIARAVDLAVERLTNTMASPPAVLQDRTTRKLRVAVGGIGGLFVLVALVAGFASGHVATLAFYDMCSTEVFDVTDGGRGCFVE